MSLSRSFSLPLALCVFVQAFALYVTPSLSLILTLSLLLLRHALFLCLPLCLSPSLSLSLSVCLSVCVSLQARHRHCLMSTTLALLLRHSLLLPSTKWLTLPQALYLARPTRVVDALSAWHDRGRPIFRVPGSFSLPSTLLRLNMSQVSATKRSNVPHA